MTVTGSETAPPEDTRPAVRGRKFHMALIASLYSTQNLSLAMFAYAFLTIAQAGGVPLTRIGGASGLATLLVLKFLWAPVVDRFGSDRFGHYRSWLMAMQITLVAGCALLSFIDPVGQFSVALVVFGFLFIVAGTQDIAADATATRLLSAGDRGLGNGFQSAGSAFSQVVGGGLVLVIYDTAGWQAAALSLAFWSAVPLPFVLLWRERQSTARLPEPGVNGNVIRSFFADRARRQWALVHMPLYFAGVAVAYNQVRPILVAADWSATRIGILFVICGSLFGIVAGIGAGILTRKLSRHHAIRTLGLIQAMTTVGVVLLALGMTGTWAATLIIGILYGGVAATMTVVYTVAMDLTRYESAGTDFTVFSTLAALVMVLSAGGGMALSGLIGFLPVSVVAVVLAFIGVGVVIRGCGPVLEAAAVRQPGAN
ncbi:MFS transporter [Corynebacterium antarcticum]|uniref:MFS transporter n=1 Tax=Corynebacterium antarcticum TaxID=2800405 RepID=UPI00226087D2|nr:MFS transporter [Corynebacterium antarcticum]MCX7540506.1 MFS transporter [Corynebacterium antarcticum]